MEKDLRWCEDERLEAIVTAHVTFYITEFRSAFASYSRAYQLVMEQLEAHVNWYRTDQMTRMKETSSAQLAEFPFWFSDPQRVRSEYNLILSSGDHPEGVGPYRFDFWLVPAELPINCGYFHVALPAADLEDNPGKLRQLVTGIADAMPFRSGHAGYAVTYDEGFPNPRRDIQIAAWCRRYLGLDCPALPDSTLQMARHIKGVNWLTILDEQFYERLKPDAVLQTTKSIPTINITDVVHGHIIQAGELPRLGDVNQGEAMPEYKAVNRLVRDLRTPDLLPLPGMDREQTREWLDRFD